MMILQIKTVSERERLTLRMSKHRENVSIYRKGRLGWAEDDLYNCGQR